MSALALRKVNKEAATGACLEDGCNLKGRYEISIADHRLIATSRFLSCRSPEVLCNKHAKRWKEAWAELSGEAAWKEAEAAVALLASVASDESDAAQVSRTDAMDSLATIGFDSQTIAVARARALDGWSVGEIVEGLVPSREAVMA